MEGEAVLHRLAAGTVAFASHQASVADVSFHWSKDAVNDLASRMILNGNGLVDLCGRHKCESVRGASFRAECSSEPCGVCRYDREGTRYA